MIELKEPLPPGAVCVGIDVAKAKLDVCIDGSPKRRPPFTVPNTPAGRGKLIERLRGLMPGLARVVVESSGGYERPLLFELHDAGLPGAHVNPRVVRDYAKGLTSWPRATRSTAACSAATAASASRGCSRPTIDCGTCSRT